MSSMNQSVYQAALELVEGLKARKLKLGLAESCTGGAIAAILTEIPGVSDTFCGSAVTYRNDTKANWLKVSPEDLANPRIGPVSEQVARQMALGVLKATPEADIAGAITGHFGPDAPEGWDGVIFTGIAIREELRVTVQRWQLSSTCEDPTDLRRIRRSESIHLLFSALQYSLT